MIHTGSDYFISPMSVCCFPYPLFIAGFHATDGWSQRVNLTVGKQQFSDVHLLADGG